jgi:hypothetical protein
VSALRTIIDFANAAASRTHAACKVVLDILRNKRNPITETIQHAAHSCKIS